MWPVEWSKQSLYVWLYVPSPSRVALRVGGLSDATDDALEVGKRFNCRGLHVTSNKSKEYERNCIMVDSGHSIIKNKDEENTRFLAKTARIEHTLRLAFCSRAATLYARFGVSPVKNYLCHYIPDRQSEFAILHGHTSVNAAYVCPHLAPCADSTSSAYRRL